MKTKHIITNFILIMIFILLLVSCKKNDEPITYKLLEDDTYEVTSFNEKHLDPHVVIPSTYNKKAVTSIGAAAFSGAKEMTSVFIPNTIISIKAEAFSGTDLLDNVIFEENSTLKVIGNYAFYGALELTSIDLPTSLEEIGSFAFGKTKFTTFNFPENITHFPSNLFVDVETLQTVTISKNIDQLHKDAFNGLKNLKAINVASGNGHFKSVEGILYNLDQTEIIKYPEAKQELSFSIPNTVTKIVEKAFKDVQFLKNITIPNSMTTIESYAFEKTQALESVTIPNSVINIGESMFKEAASLHTVELPNSLEKIPYMSFYRATNLVTVFLPNNLKYIDAYAFGYTENLELSNFPNGLLEIGNYAFYGSNKIKDLTIPKSVETIGNASLSNMEKLKTLTFEEDSSLTVIGNKAFADNKSLTSIVIPEDVITIGQGALSGSNKIESVTIPFVGSSLAGRSYQAQFAFIFGTTAFEDSYDVVYLNSLSTKYYVPNKLKEVIITGGSTIYDNAFDGVNSVERLVLPENLTTINKYAFKNMSHLKSLVIPDSVITVEKGALVGTNRLETLTVPFIGESLTATNEKAQFAYIFGDEQFIGSYKVDYLANENKDFYLPESLKEVSVKGGKIADYAFSGAKEIENLTIPNDLLTIGDYAFNEMSKLKEITLPNTLTSFGKNLLSGAKALKEITIPENITVIEDAFLQNASSIDQIIIPNGITRIGKYAFDGISVKTLEIPETVTDIDAYAFRNLENLTIINIPETVINIGEGVFNLASQLIIYVEAAEKPNTWHNSWNNSNRPVYFGINEQNLFEEDGILYVLVDDYLIASRFVGDKEEIIIGDINGKEVKEIGSFAFYGATNILKVELPATITKIGASAFNNASRLQVINIPISVDVIGNSAFLGTSDLITYVEAEAVGENWHDRWIPSGRPIHFNVGLDDIINFDNTYYIIKDEKVILTRHLGGLETIRIPRKINGLPVETISGSAFTNIKGLYSVYIHDGISTVGLAAFHNVDSTILYVEAEAVGTSWDNRWNISNRPVYFDIKETDLIEVGGAEYILIDNEYLALTRYYGATPTWTVPREVNGKEVRVIKKEALSHLDVLKSLFILDNIINVETSILKESLNAVIYIEHENVPLAWATNWNEGKNIVYFGISEDDLIVHNNTDYILKNEQLTLTRYYGNDITFIIPDDIEDNSVKNIGKEAFLNASSLEYVVILENITKVDENAFSGDVEMVIYIEFIFLPVGWNLNWNGASLTFYLADQWTLDNGIPVLIEQ